MIIYILLLKRLKASRVQFFKNIGSFIMIALIINSTFYRFRIINIKLCPLYLSLAYFVVDYVLHLPKIFYVNTSFNHVFNSLNDVIN